MDGGLCVLNVHVRVRSGVEATSAHLKHQLGAAVVHRLHENESSKHFEVALVTSESGRDREGWHVPFAQCQLALEQNVHHVGVHSVQVAGVDWARQQV